VLHREQCRIADCGSHPTDETVNCRGQQAEGCMRGYWLGALGLATALTMTPVQAAQSELDIDTRGNLIAWLDRLAAADLAARAKAIAAIDTPAEAQRRQDATRARILQLIGGLPKDDAPLAPHIVARFEGDGYRYESLVFDGLAGEHITADLFLPARGTGPFPAVLLSPGHWLSGKLTNFSFGANLARNGFVSLAYDLPGEGERMQYWEPRIGATLGERSGGEHTIAAFQTMLVGDHLSRYFINDAIRGIDYLASLKEVDADRIGALGCSGGGTQSAYVAAVDPRVKAVASACYANTMHYELATVGPQEAEQSIPDFIADGFDLPDWFEMAAPRPYAIVSTTEDMFPFAGARAAVDEMRHFWAAYGAADRVEWITGPGPHGNLEPLGGRIVDFFRRWLKPVTTQVPYETLRPALPENVLAMPTGQVATSGGSLMLADINRARAAEVAAHTRDPAALAAAIRKLTRAAAVPGAAPPKIEISEVSRPGLVIEHLRFVSPAGSLPAVLMRRAGADPDRILLLLDATPLGTLAAPDGRATRLARAGWTVLALHPRGSDGTEQIKSSIVGDKNFLDLRALIVGRTLIGIRIDDTIRATDWLAVTFKGVPITVDGVGTMGPVALQAAALDPRLNAIRIENSQVSWRAAADMPIQRDLPEISAPGVLAAYDLPDVMAALAPRPVTVAAPTDPLDDALTKAQAMKWVGGIATVRYAPYADDPH
jgi:cephalosporin-C deacetylase-like acetyl esterase